MGAPMGAPGAMAAAGGQQLAPWGERVASYAIDGLALGVLAFLVSAVSEGLGFLVNLVAIAFLFYNAYLNGQTGQSIGKRVVGTKVVGAETGQPIGGGMGIVRLLCHFFDGLVCFIGYLFPLWDAKKQTFADKIVKTVVLTGLDKKPLGEALKG